MACTSGDHAASAVGPDNLFAAASRSGFSVQISPGLTPAFDQSIHDYVVDCNSTPDIDFVFSSSESLTLGYFGPGNEATGPLSYEVNYFHGLVKLAAGQRFRFIVGEGSPEYSVRCLPKNFPPLSVSTGDKRAAQWYLFAPTLSISNATSGALSYVVITDANGTPVWWQSDPSGPPVDAKIFGTNQIVWTTSTVFGAGGKYVFRTFDGKVQRILQGNLDQHDLKPTASGTFLAIRDVARMCPGDCADMSPWGGSAQTAVVDAEIIEIDRNSNVLWTWRTRDHIALAESGSSGWFPGVGADIIHMNAVEPDGVDGVLFSARHLNAIYHITKSTGAIDWKVGGTSTPESLTVVDDIRPTAVGPTGQALSGQHYVKKWPDGTVSVHDNGTLVNRPPSIVRFSIDTGARTAGVVEELQDVRVKASPCCGSADRLPGGHWLVAWGGLPFVTEIDSTGNPVLTIQYNMGDTFSYRAVAIASGVISATVLREGMDANDELIRPRGYRWSALLYVNCTGVASVAICTYNPAPPGALKPLFFRLKVVADRLGKIDCSMRLS